MSHRTTAHLLSLAIIGTGALSLPAADQVLSAEPVANTGTEYRLFVGLDVEVGEGDEYALVEGYVNNRVHTDGSKGLVSLRNVDDVRFTHKTKISRNPLTIENLHTEQISANVHAARDAMRNQQSLNAYRNQMTAGLISDLRAAGDPEIGADGAPVVNLSPESNQGALDAQAALSDFGSMTNESTFTDEIIGRDNDKSTAMLITAEVSSPTHIDDAYIVGVATISTDESPEEEVIFFNRIGSLDQKPRRVRIIKQGLPNKFKVRDVKIHVYRNGQELVSNQSSKQYALTREQVYEYLTLERVSQNRGKSMDPEPAWSLAPQELFATAKANAFDYPLTVHVDAHGKVTGIDPNKFVPGKVVKVVMELPFYPGLENGQAIASNTLVNLASFFR